MRSITLIYRTVHYRPSPRFMQGGQDHHVRISEDNLPNFGKDVLQSSKVWNFKRDEGRNRGEMTAHGSMATIGMAKLPTD
jgi:hypothetical protein